MRALPLLAALLLSACDTSEGPPPGGPYPAALVGTWSLSAIETEAFAMSNVAQSLPDFDGPTTGQITVTGAETGLLPYVTYLNMPPGDTYRAARFTSSDPLAPAPSIQALDLEVYGTDAFGTLRLNVASPARQESYGASQLSAVPLTFAAGRLRLESTSLTSTSTPARQVQVEGEIVFPITPLPAGERTRVRQFAAPASGFRYTFGAAGSYRAERDTNPNTVESVTGTWVVDGELLLLSVMRGEVTETQTFTYVVADGRLRLRYPLSSCRDNGCLRNAAAELGLPAGSLTDYDFTQTLVFESGATSKAAASAPVGERALWPRMLARPATRSAS